MATIVTRSGKGSALTFVEADANFNNLNDDKIELTDITVNTQASVIGNASTLTYNNVTGVLTFTPVDTSVYMDQLADDLNPQLGGDLDVNGRAITSTAINGDIVLHPNGSGVVKVLNELDLVGGTITTTVPDGDVNISGNGDGLINLNGSTTIADLLSFSETIESLISVSGTVNLDPEEGPLKYVVPSGNITLGGFASAVAGQTVTLLIDQATAGSNFTFTLSPGQLSPLGDGVALTASGYDLITITCVDANNGLYIVTSVNDFQ